MSIAKRAVAPAVAAWATKLAGLSTSLTVSVPEVRNVGGRIGLGQIRGRRTTDTAASLVPRMLMVTEVRVPSALVTEKVSV